MKKIYLKKDQRELLDNLLQKHVRELKAELAQLKVASDGELLEMTIQESETLSKLIELEEYERN